MVTEHCAFRTQCSPTDRSNALANAPRPRFPSTRRSAPWLTSTRGHGRMPAEPDHLRLHWSCRFDSHHPTRDHSPERGQRASGRRAPREVMG
jgi:hypothetical protein